MEEQYRLPQMVLVAQEGPDIDLRPQLMQTSDRYYAQPWLVRIICELWTDQILEYGSAKLRKLRCRKSGAGGLSG